MAALYTAHGLPTDEHAYLERFDGGMLNVIYAWCGGLTRANLTLALALTLTRTLTLT